MVCSRIPFAVIVFLRSLPVPLLALESFRSSCGNFVLSCIILYCFTLFHRSHYLLICLCQSYTLSSIGYPYSLVLASDYYQRPERLKFLNHLLPRFGPMQFSAMKYGKFIQFSTMFVHQFQGEMSRRVHDSNADSFGIISSTLS